MTQSIEREASASTSPRPTALQTVYVDRFTNGILDPGKPMLGPVQDGGFIVANTAPGCWGPMITPSLHGGHEVTIPVAVEGAEVGDTIAVFIRSIRPTSQVTASGNDLVMENRFLGDPFVAARCPNCGTLHPETRIEGIGPEAIRCVQCGADVTPFTFKHGYTIALNTETALGVTLQREAAEQVAHAGRRYMAVPEHSVQNPIVTFAPSDLVGVIARLRPFLGQLGTTPARPLPDSHNAGDFGSFLVGAPHEYAVTEEQLEDRTDGHMDINRVREGALLLCPVKVQGGGVYLGDMHAMQGNGEIAGHTTDVAGLVTLQVRVIKGLTLDGPVLFPVAADLPYLAQPFSAQEREQAGQLAAQWGLNELEESAPISFVGTGVNLNVATDNGLKRAADFLGMSVPEVLNRATITGSIDIGRHPGVVTVTLLAPVPKLREKGVWNMVKDHYGLEG